MTDAMLEAEPDARLVLAVVNDPPVANRELRQLIRYARRQRWKRAVWRWLTFGLGARR